VHGRAIDTKQGPRVPLKIIPRRTFPHPTLSCRETAASPVAPQHHHTTTPPRQSTFTLTTQWRKAHVPAASRSTTPSYAPACLGPSRKPAPSASTRGCSRPSSRRSPNGLPWTRPKMVSARFSFRLQSADISSPRNQGSQERRLQRFVSPHCAHTALLVRPFPPRSCAGRLRARNSLLLPRLVL
jgi:hypothetical protein